MQAGAFFREITFSVAVRAKQTNYDCVITDARIGEGTDIPWFTDEIGILGDRIAAAHLNSQRTLPQSPSELSGHSHQSHTVCHAGTPV